MKWLLDKPVQLKEGQQRTVKKFLFWPRTFGRDKRWLEYANIIETVVWRTGSIDGPMSRYIWVETDFADNRTRYIEMAEKSQQEQEL